MQMPMTLDGQNVILCIWGFFRLCSHRMRCTRTLVLSPTVVRTTVLPATMLRRSFYVET
jgi:hypothetical protein